MKKTMKKATVLFAACALSMAALAGCGDKKDASSSSQATQQSAAPSTGVRRYLLLSFQENEKHGGLETREFCS